MTFFHRLCKAGMEPEFALVIICDFKRENDYDGLKIYVEEYEALKNVGKVQSESCEEYNE